MNVDVKPVKHRGGEQVALYFPNRTELINVAKQLGCQWSQSNKYWYLPREKNIDKKIIAAYRGTAWVDASALHNGRSPVAKVTRPPRPKKAKAAPRALNNEQQQALEQFRKWLLSKGYSDNTIPTYCGMLAAFFRYIDKKPIKQVVENDVIDFNAEFIVTTGRSASYQRQAVNAIKLFYNSFEGHKLNTAKLQRVKKQKKLPEVLSLGEVQDLINSYSNIKHKCMIVLTYSCGLRRSETLNLTWKHIDRARMLLYVRLGKGNKDRAVVLPQATLKLLEVYYRQHTPKPKHFVFEGAYEKQYSATSFTKVLKQGLAKSGIKKSITLHCLRHSYATHLHEQGTDIMVLQKLLGHQNLSTTVVYTHISKKT